VLLLGVLLAVVGAVVIWWGRPRERFIVYAGGLAFAIGVILVVWWLITELSEETDIEEEASLLIGGLADWVRRAAGPDHGGRTVGGPDPSVASSESAAARGPRGGHRDAGR
jgi:4-amino-4-deoxy-L-arabinose transferase-like glycosyltransferase